MNTRLQVEHPITERVVGIDLVKTQINIADNKQLEFKQEDLKQTGHAIEVRIYAEDPDNNFMPNPGKIEHMTEPLGLGVRHDGYVYTGYEIPIYYDPMISKLIVWALTRQEAIDRLKRALYAYKITGIKTTIPFLHRILDVPDFVNGKYNTHFIQDNAKYLEPKKNSPQRVKDMSAIAVFVDHLNNLEKFKDKRYCKPTDGNWKAFGRKRNVTRL